MASMAVTGQAESLDSDSVADGRFRNGLCGRDRQQGAQVKTGNSQVDTAASRRAVVLKITAKPVVLKTTVEPAVLKTTVKLKQSTKRLLTATMAVTGRSET